MRETDGREANGVHLNSFDHRKATLVQLCEGMAAIPWLEDVTQARKESRDMSAKDYDQPGPLQLQLEA